MSGAVCDRERSEQNMNVVTYGEIMPGCTRQGRYCLGTESGVLIEISQHFVQFIE